MSDHDTRKADMTDATEFVEAADHQTAMWSGLVRQRVDNPRHVQHVQFVATDEDFENVGATMFAVASVGTDHGHVAMSIHAFVDGARVTPVVQEIGGELFITIANA